MTLIAQFVPAARVVPQSLLSEKLPLADMPAIVMSEPPVLVSVTVWGRLFVPTACEPKARLEGERLADGGVAPFPVRVMV